MGPTVLGWGDSPPEGLREGPVVTPSPASALDMVPAGGRAPLPTQRKVKATESAILRAQSPPSTERGVSTRSQLTEGL